MRQAAETAEQARTREQTERPATTDRHQKTAEDAGSATGLRGEARPLRHLAHLMGHRPSRGAPVRAVLVVGALKAGNRGCLRSDAASATSIRKP